MKLWKPSNISWNSFVISPKLKCLCSKVSIDCLSSPYVVVQLKQILIRRAKINISSSLESLHPSYLIMNSIWLFDDEWVACAT